MRYLWIASTTSALLMLGFSGCADYTKTQWADLNDQATEAWVQAYYDKGFTIATDALRAAETAGGTNDPNVATVLNTLGIMEMGRGNYSKARECFQRSLGYLEAAYGSSHPRLAAPLNSLAILEMAHTNYDAAIRFASRALDVRPAGESKHTDVVRSLNTLGLGNLERGKLAESEKYFKKAIELASEIEADRDIGVAYKGLCHIYLLEDRPDDAKTMFNKGADIDRRYYRLGHPKQAETLLVQSAIKASNLEYDGALADAEAAVAMLRAALGENHPHVAGKLLWIGRLQLYLDKPVEAGQLQERALDVFQRKYGSNHPVVAEALADKARVHVAQKNYTAAESLYVRALATWDKSSFQDNRRIADLLHELTQFYHGQRIYEKQEALLIRAIKLSEAEYGRDDRDVATLINNLGVAYFLQDKYQKAEEQHRRALAIRERLHGHEHPDVALSLSRIAVLCGLQQRYDEAETLHLRALEIRKKFVRPGHLVIVRSQFDLARLYSDMNMHAKAEEYYLAACSTGGRETEYERVMMAAMLTELGELYCRQDRYEEAAPLFHDALAIDSGSNIGSGSYAVKILSNLAGLYEKTGQDDKAREYAKRAEEARAAAEKTLPGT